MQDKLFIAIRNKYREFATEINPEGCHMAIEINDIEYSLWVSPDYKGENAYFNVSTYKNGEVTSRKFTEKDDTEVILKELDRAIKFLKGE